MSVSSPKFTHADYMELPEGFPAELLHGQLVKQPSRTPWHQVLLTRLALHFDRVVAEDRVLIAPVDVALDEHNVLQPDILVLPPGAGPGPEDRQVQTPQLVVEILSPSTARRDREVKRRVYLEGGIVEVWIVDPEKRTVEVWGAGGRRESAGLGEVIASEVLPALTLVPEEIFAV